MAREQGTMTPKEVQVVERLRPQWKDITDRLVSWDHDTEAEAMFEEIVQRYRTGDGRSYHNLFHIDRMLTFVDKFKYPSTNIAALKAAIFGHDIVYVPGSQTNEEESAEVFGDMMGRMGVFEFETDEIKRLILITKDHKVPSWDSDGDLIVDADFSIFAASEDEYDEYSQGIRQEYVGSGRVSEEEFRKVRAGLLQGWIDQENIFLIPEVRAQSQSQAIVNLKRELARLTV